MSKIAVFAGTFDPFTLGHYDIVKRSSQLFDKLIIAIASETQKKNPKTDLANRATIAKLSTKDILNVEVLSFEGFLTDFMKKVGAKYLIRGLRSSADFDYERSLNAVYISQNPEIETFYLISSQNNSHICATIVRELTRLKGDIDGYVHKNAIELVKSLY